MQGIRMLGTGVTIGFKAIFRILTLISFCSSLFDLISTVESYRSSVSTVQNTKRFTELYSSKSRTGGTRPDKEYQGKSKIPTAGPMRNGENINYVAEWQAKGDLYISYDHLLKLDNSISSSRSKSKGEKSSIIEELSLTYFAR